MSTQESEEEEKIVPSTCQKVLRKQTERFVSRPTKAKETKK